MYTSWSIDCPLSTACSRVLLLYSQQRLSNFLKPITLFLALHQMVLDLLTPITTTPVSAELKNWCLVIMSCVGSAEEMAERVHEYSYIQQRWNILLFLSCLCIGSHLSASCHLSPVILGFGASAEEMAECVDRKSYEENNKGEQYSLFEVSTTISPYI